MAKIDSNAEQFASCAERDQAVLDRMITYGQSARCRWRMLLDYFATDVAGARSRASSGDRKPTDELGGESCGVCDNCMHPPTLQESPREIQAPARARELTRTFAVGDVVRVRRYGEGTVEMVSGDRVAVRCSDDETRTFIARYVKRAASHEAHRSSRN
ncbi:protein of unknown function (plasmid) [Caballeronia sp. S22]